MQVNGWDCSSQLNIASCPNTLVATCSTLCLPEVGVKCASVWCGLCVCACAFVCVVWCGVAVCVHVTGWVVCSYGVCAPQCFRKLSYYMYVSMDTSCFTCKCNYRQSKGNFLCYHRQYRFCILNRNSNSRQSLRVLITRPQYPF